VRQLIVDLGRDFRGGQHQALLLLRGLRERGHAAELIAVRDSLLASRALEIGIPVHLADPGRRRLSAALHIRKLAGNRSLDILHANEPHALSAAWFARASGVIPVVVSRRIALPISKGFISMARYRGAARVIAVSHFVERSVIHSGLTANQIKVIYDGVEIPPEPSATQRENARLHFGIPNEAICIGNVAALVPEKGHELLVESFAKLRLRYPECVLLIRGNGPELPRLQALASQFLIGDAVKFLPSSEDIETLFAAMDIFAFPSHEEPLGSALLAGMAHALPVVAFACGGIPEVVEDGKNGLLIKSVDSEMFASSLARLIASREEAARLGKAARETIEKSFSASRMVDETLRVFENLVLGGVP
jgi:glycosyltransferase involved in cell wall biosynthesis